MKPSAKPLPKTTDTSPISSDLKKALTVSPSVMVKWDSLTEIAKRDFISWIESAKQEETRLRRITITRDKLISGKRRPCCYAVVPMNLYKALDASPDAKATWKSLTSNERRDFTDWIDEGKEKSVREERIVKVSTMLAKGKRRP
jgi:uncharacterized protein YdeI (YjbR/CyaY-like superfamily)